MEDTRDLSVVLCLHREGSLLKATLQSLREAILFARADGIHIELVAVIDDADAITRAVLLERSEGLPCSVQIIEVNNKSLGLSRNAGVAAAQGEWICFADGDDLVSYNTFSAFFSWGRKLGERVVLMPEWLLTFGARASVNLVPPLTLVGPLNLLTSNPFVSRVCLHRSAIGRTAFVNVRPQDGYAYEDWHHHCEMIACGYDLRPAPETILFYRLREDSLSGFSERFSSGAIPPSSLFAREIFLRRCEDDYRSFESNRRELLVHRQSCGNVLETALITAANRIEPAISMSLTQLSIATPLSDYHKSVGALYFRLCRAVDDVFDHIAVTGRTQVGRLVESVALSEPGTNVRNLLVLSFKTKPDGACWNISPKRHGVQSEKIVIIEIEHDEQANEAICLKAIQSLFGSAKRICICNDEFGSAFFRRFGSALGASEGFDPSTRINLVKP